MPSEVPVMTEDDVLVNLTKLLVRRRREHCRAAEAVSTWEIAVDKSANGQRRIALVSELEDLEHDIAGSADGKSLESARDQEQAAGAEIRNAESELRAYAVALYSKRAAIGPTEKKLSPAVSIRVTPSLEYDEATVLAWCNQHVDQLRGLYGTAFIVEKLDRKGFEKVAVNMPAAPVKKIETPTAVPQGT